MDLKNAIEGLKCISCGEYDLALLNVTNSSSESQNQGQLTESQLKFFENLDDILEQNRIDTPTRWSFICFLSRYGIFKGKEAAKALEFQIDSAINEFEKISKKDRLLKNLKLFLFGHNVEIPKIQSDKLALEISREILYVSSHHNSLYRTLQLLFRPLLSEITDVRLFKLLGYSAFQLYSPSPPREFWSIRLFTTNEQYRDIIYYSQDVSFLNALQQDYVGHFQYPNDFPGSLTFNSSSCSLLMTSIYKNVHFVDLLSLLIREKIHKLEIGLIPEIARVAPSFVPILFAAYQPFLYLSPQVFLRLITAKLPAINNPENNFCYKNGNFSENIIELQQRFINDLLFTKLVVDLNNENFNNVNGDQDPNPKKKEKKKSFFSKKKKTEEPNNPPVKPRVRRDSDLGLFIRDFGCPVNEILKNHSIPFLCNGHFRRPEFIEFENKKFYIFNDDEVQNDFDFIHTFNSISDAIELLQTTKIKNQNMIPVQRSLLASIEKNLQSIKEPNLLKKVAIDIFSLIFLKENQNENSNFLCQNLEIAYLIIMVLKKFFNNDRFIKFGSLLLSHYTSIKSRKYIYGISYVLKSNLNFLLDIIIKQNWDDARDAALLLSGNQTNDLDYRSKIYWKVYLLSLAVHMLKTGKSCNVECEEFKESLNLEISLSSSIYNTDDCINFVLSLIEKQPSSKEKEDKLALIKNINKIRELRKKVEFDDFFSALCDYHWIDVEPAVVNLEMFPFDFFTNNLIERYGKPLKKTKLLFEFVSFIDVYFKCIYNNDNNNNNNDLFYFNPARALSNAINNGKIELAEKLASLLNIDLFDFIMKNQKEFKFTPNVVDHFCSKYPLECTEIFYFLNKNQKVQLNSENLTKFVKSNEKVEKIFNYLNSDKANDNQTTLEEPIESEFIELIKSAKENENNDDLYKEFDDYLYKLNHSRISQIVVSNFESINKEVALYLLNIVGYTIDMNSLNDEIKKLLLQKEINKIIHAKEITQKDQIVEYLIESDRFDLAAKFITLNYQSQQEKDEICVKTIRKLTSVDNDDLISLQIRKFVVEFENQSYLYELIASEIQEKISIIIEICPDSIKPSLIAFSSLPDSIRSVSSLVDKSTISKAICTQIRENNFDVFLLDKKNLILFDDDDLRSIIEELSNCCTNIQDFIKYSTYLSNLVGKSNDIFVTTNSNRVLKELESMNVDSIEKEFEAFLIITKLARFNRVCKLDDKISSIIKAINLLIIESPFYFTKIAYSIPFQKSDSNQFGLFDVLLKLDLDSIANLLPKDIFNSFDYTKQKVENMLKLGRFDDALHILNVNKQYVYEMDELFLYPFLYKQFYHSNLLPLICNLCSNVDQFFSHIQTISNSESELSVSVNSSLTNLLNYKEFVSYCKTKTTNLPFLSFCSDFCERFSTKDSFFRFCIRRGAMTTVVSKFMTLDENENFNYDINNNSQEFFINTIVECSIEFDKFQLLKKEMINFSKSNSKNSVTNYWKYLINFCEKRGMGFLMLETSELLSLRDKIASSYIDIFGEIDEKDISKKIQYLDKARMALKECIEHQQPINNNTKSNSNSKEITSKNQKIRRNKSNSLLGNNSEIDAENDSSSLSQQSSLILFDPDEFNNKNPDEFCEYDYFGSIEDDDDKKSSKSKNAKKYRIHFGYPELLVIGDLLSQFLPFFLEKNEPFPESMNLFNGSLACLALGGFFLRNRNFDLLQKISKIMKVPQKAIVNAFFESITKCKELQSSNFQKEDVNQTKNENEIKDMNSNQNENEIKDIISNQNENVDSNSNEIIKFIEDMKNEESFWNSNDFYYVHLFTSKLSFSKNFNLIPLVLDKILPPEKEPAMLLEFDFLNEAFLTIKEKNVANELIPMIAARASILGDCEMVRKCENELGIIPEENSTVEINGE